MQEAPWNELRSEVHAERWGRVTELLDGWPEDSHEQARDYACSYGWVPASLDADDLEVATIYRVWSTRGKPEGKHREFLPTLVLELKDTGKRGERIWSTTIPEDDGSKGQEECFELTCHVNQGVLAIKPAISMALSQSDMRYQLKMIEACAWIASVDFVRFHGMIRGPRGPCPPGIVVEAVNGKPWRSPFDVNSLAFDDRADALGYQMEASGLGSGRSSGRVTPEGMTGILSMPPIPPERLRFQGVATKEPVTIDQFIDQREASRHGLEQVQRGRRRKRRGK